LIFNDEENRAMVYYKCVFYFDKNSGLIDKVVFINLNKAYGKKRFED
jgi:hypothetical protein